MADRKIPYVTIFGNHDDEKTLSREAQMSIIESLPYSLSKAGPETVDGVGNYYIEILARGGRSDHSALTLYMLDTHAYTPNEKKWPGYDWIKPTQIEWFHNTANTLKPKHKEYTRIHMDLAFIHIPLPEYNDINNYWRGRWREFVTAPRFNSGFRNALVEQGVVMVSCGQ
jgi:DNA repair exonuclease SbcCD nuclease subunit